jgi:hypothetical protein
VSVACSGAHGPNRNVNDVHQIVGSNGNVVRPCCGAAIQLTRLAFRGAALAALAALGACGNVSIGPASDTDPLAAANLTVSIDSNPRTVVAGQSVVLNWSATAAQSCTASGGWSGTQPISGTLSTIPLTATTSYTLTCTGASGSVSQSIEVTVVEQGPAVALMASPTSVSSGGTSTLTWNSTSAMECTAGGGWQGPVATSGTWLTSSLTNTTNFELTCTGPGGSSSQSTTVTVGALSPAVTVQANPSTVVSGGVSTLTWTSQNATSCSASGAWSGARSLGGSQSIGPITGNSTYALTCTGKGGSASQNVIVTVTPAITGSATLTWTAPSQNTDGSPLTTISGYTVYYGTSSSLLTQSVVVSGANTTSYMVTGLAAGTWYFGVTANALDGTSSALSNITSKTF